MVKMGSFVKILIGTVLGTGFIPFAPATFASALTIPLILILSPVPLLYFIFMLAFFGLGVFIATNLEKAWGKDARRITIDELVGMLITFFLIKLPPTTGSRIGVILIGFFLFRFFDIVKLPLIKKSQELTGGWGVMIDDVLTAIVANLGLRFLMVIFL